MSSNNNLPSAPLNTSKYILNNQGIGGKTIRFYWSVREILFWRISQIILFQVLINLLGGTPYPLLSNAELVRLLRSGYRMEKPDLCSDDV